MGTSDKPKLKLMQITVLPHLWFLKLRQLRRRSILRRSSLKSEQVATDSAPFLPKTVENCYKRVRVFSPLKSVKSTTVEQSFISSPDKVPVIPYPVSTSGKKSLILGPVNSIMTSIDTNVTRDHSIFSGCTYRSSISSLRNLCRLVGSESLAVKGGSPVSFRKSAAPTLRAWFVAGCGILPRGRGSRPESIDDLEKESGLIELDDNADTGLESTGGGDSSSWPKKGTSWSGEDLALWNVELTSAEVVKRELILKKRKESKGKSSKSWDLTSPRSDKATSLASLLSRRSDDSPKKGFVQEAGSGEVIPGRLSSLSGGKPKKRVPPWSSLSSFGSGDSFMSSSDVGLKIDRKPLWSNSDSEPVVNYSEETDKGSISDSQSLLQAKVLAAERQREGSRSWREQRREQQKEEETTMLLASLDKALYQQSLRMLIEEDEDTDQGNVGSGFSSPKSGIHNSPVFESFLESSAKAWGMDIPTLNSAKTSGSISDRSRELRCITFQSPETERERDRDRDPTRGARLDSSPARKETRRSRRFEERESPKRRSLSRKPSPKHVSDDRTSHPQREESTGDPELFDEFNNARKINGSRRRSKQRKSSKPVGSLLDVSVSPVPERLQGMVKESVAVVVESSYDPYKDFRESMIEMIVDQDIQETGDLEELLQCYLSLNEAEYHTVIVDVFTDVWHELFETTA